MAKTVSESNPINEYYYLITYDVLEDELKKDDRKDPKDGDFREELIEILRKSGVDNKIEWKTKTTIYFSASKPILKTEDELSKELIGYNIDFFMVAIKQSENNKPIIRKVTEQKTEQNTFKKMVKDYDGSQKE